VVSVASSFGAKSSRSHRGLRLESFIRNCLEGGASQRSYNSPPLLLAQEVHSPIRELAVGLV
jgi:hypothetical protein